MSSPVRPLFHAQVLLVGPDGVRIRILPGNVHTIDRANLVTGCPEAPFLDVEQGGALASLRGQALHYQDAACRVGSH